MDLEVIDITNPDCLAENDVIEHNGTVYVVNEVFDNVDVIIVNATEDGSDESEDLEFSPDDIIGILGYVVVEI